MKSQKVAATSKDKDKSKSPPPQRDRISLSPPKTATSQGRTTSQKASSPPRASTIAPKAAPTTTSTSQRSAASSKAPLRPSSQAQKILPKGKKPAVGGSKPSTAGASKSSRDLSQTMHPPNINSSLKSPLKGILKKPRNLDESLVERQRLAASDDEQIRKINFQHHLQMAHQEKKGFFPEEEDKDPLENTIVNTNPATLGLSLLNNTVNSINQNPLPGHVNGVDQRQRPEEVVLGHGLPTSGQPPSRLYKMDKPINYANLDWAFKEFMKVQEDMISRGQIDQAIKNLEEGLNERLSLYPAKDDGVWKLTMLLADVNIKTAVRLLNNNQVDESIKYLKEARKVTEPLPNADWSEKPEWVTLRKSVYKNLATYHQRKEDWGRALENFKVALKLDSSPINPDPLGAANTSLTCAVILSKLNKYAESIDYAQACMGAIEELGNIDKSVPLSVYKQQIQAHGTKANGGKMPEQDKMMTTYSICLHLLGKNLANLKYFNESKVFFQRAQYVASHLTQQPKEDLVRTIANDIQNLHKNFNKPLPDRNIIGGGDRQLTIEETDSALQTIKTNLANASYSLAADFEEQKALLDQLIQKEDDKANVKSRYDDKSLQYVKAFIEEKKRKEKTAIDEYREKIAKDFDQKQTEFLQKQQKVKQAQAKIKEKNQKFINPKVTGKKADGGGTTSGGERTSGEATSQVRSKPPARGMNSRSAGLPEQSIKAGDFEAEERKTRVKKPEKNLAAEGAKLDNLALRYSGEKGNKQFFHKRRVNIEKVNENLGYFGGGIMDNDEGEVVTLEAPTSPGGATQTEYNPFEDENLAGAANNATISSPKKGGKAESPVKLPPVRGYKLDTLGLDELGETVVKKSMDAGYGSENPFKSGYKNPHTRKLLQSMDNKEYGKFTRAKSFKSDKDDKSPLAKQQQRVDITPKDGPKPIREIPTYKPPVSSQQQQSDWREQFRGGGDSDEELLDTKKVIEKLNKSQLKDKRAQSTLSRGDNSIFDDEQDNNDDPFFNDEINQREHDQIYKTATSKSFSLPPAVKQSPAPLTEPSKPPKVTKQHTEEKPPNSGRLPQINKRFQEDTTDKKSTQKLSSPEKNQQDSTRPKQPAKSETINKKGVTDQRQQVKKESTSPPQERSPPASKSPEQQPSSKSPKPQAASKSPTSDKKPAGAGSKRASSTTSSRLTGLKKKSENEDEKPQTAASYVPPNKRLTKAQKLKQEEEEKAKKDKENAKKKKKDLEQEEGKQMKRQFDEDRLAKLATPKISSKPESKEEKRESGKSPKNDGDEKFKDIADKLSRGKAMDFMSYLDRDVPAIDNKVKKKLEKAKSEAKLEVGGASGRNSARNSGRRSNSQRQQNNIDGVTQESAADGGSPSRSQKGLLAGMSLDRNAGLTLQGLRQIETKAATTIQRFMRGYFTKKWYMNYMMRKRLGVPFSGMEFASNVFIRQFNKPNQNLHQAALQAPQLIDIVQQAGATSKNMVKKSYRHGRAGEIEGTDAEKSPGPKRLKKGVTPQQLMNDLQNQFVAKGLDAYSQFKRLGVDALTDNDGNPLYNEHGRALGLIGRVEDDPIEMEQLKNLSPRHVNVALDPLERMVPRWRGQNQERFLEVKEVADYLDRVTRVKEYEEKQREIVKSNQYQQQAKQMRRHEVTTMASFAKAQGVFNRNPNKRNEQEDDEDYDPLDPTRKQDIPGSGGPPGDDDGDGSGDGDSDQDLAPDGDGDPNKRKKKKKKKGDVGQMIRNLPFKEEDGSIPLKMYQQFSREQIVFYKRLGGVPMKWTAQAGLPFVKERKPYLPIRIYGELQNSRNMIMVYVMNLELMKISADYYQYKTNNFETIWPMILYLFNHWVRYQVKLLEVTKNNPLFGPDEFMQPMDVARQARLAELAHQVTKGMAAHGALSIHDNDYTFVNPILQDQPRITGIGGEPLEEILDVKQGMLQARDEYDDKLNFSSEIEFDERFDLEKYKTLVRPEDLVDRSAPKDKRAPVIEKIVGNRKQLFNAYRMQIQEDKKLNNELDTVGLSAPAQNMESEKHKEQLLYKMKDTQDDYDEFGRPNKKVRLKLDEIYEPIAIGSMNPFKKFLELHFVPLPGDTTGQYKLMKSLAHKGYNERQNQNVQLTYQSVALMNEERRRRLGLLPLTVIDYNCIDRAALKLKIVLDCLYPRRQINGWALIPRDVREAYIDQEWQRRKDRNRVTAARLQQFSFELIKAFGEHIIYSKAYNERQLMIEQSINKIEEYKSRKQLGSYFQQAAIANDEHRKDIKRPSVMIKRQGEPGPGQSPISKQLGSPDQTPNRDSQAELAVMHSTLQSGKQLGDDSTIDIEAQKRGLVQQSNYERLKAILGQDSPRSPGKGGAEEELGEDPNKNVEYRDEHEMPMDIPGFNDAGREPDVQDFVRDGEIFEQGIIRIKGNLYIAILIFKKIESNYENMKAIIEDRIKIHAPKSLSHQVEMLKTYKGHLRMRSKLCEFVSTHKDVLRYDSETYRLIRPTEKLMLESEMSTKQKTKYKTYLEIKVCSKMSDTIWDDAFNLPWEKVSEFFGILDHPRWKLHDLLIKKKMSYKERFLFFNFFGMTLSIRDTLLQFDPHAFDLDTFKFNQIFMKQDELIAMRSRFGQMPYYFDDMIKNGTGFDECKFDKSVSPFYDVDLAQKKIKQKLVQAQREGIIFEAAELHPDRARLFKDIDEPIEEDDEAATEGVYVIRYEERKKPELLVDEATKEYLMGNHDKTNMFNLTLTNFPQSDGLFLGRVQLGNSETYRTPFNLRLDYFSIGFMPTLQIKAYNVIYPEAFELKLYHKQTIKSFIRICNLSNSSMIINQLQSAITVGRKVVGKYLKLNFNRHDLNVKSGIGTQHGQDFINMAIANEQLIRTMLKDEYRQWSGVMFFDNLGGRNLVTLSEFEIDMYQQLHGYQAMVHMNKHLSLEDKKNDRNKIEYGDPTKPPGRRYQKVKLWKVNVFNMADSKTYETVISYDDLVNYYESEFLFKVQAQFKKPDLIRLLSDYLRTLYIYRSKVGPVLYWRLPLYKRPLDPNSGLALEVPPEQMYKLKMLYIYHALQKKIDVQGRHEDHHSGGMAPITMDQLKAKKSKKEPPALSLRSKLVIEKELPIYEESQALRVLKVTSSVQEVLNQRPKFYRLSPTSKPALALVTVLLHPLMECWLWQLYFPQTQRLFTCVFYPSDLFNMNTDIYSKTNKKNKNASIWIEMVKRSELQVNPTGDIIIVVDKFKEPIKEILFQDHVYNDNAQDIFFMEVVLKTHNNYVTNVNQSFSFIDTSVQNKLNEYHVQLRAFSLTRNVWIKDQMPLYEVIKILKQEQYLMPNIKNLYYTMIRDAAVMLAHKIIFSDEAKTSEVKKKALTYDIRELQSDAETMEKLKKQHMKDLRRKYTDVEGLSEAEQKGLKTEWRNLIDLNKIFYQAVIAQNPTQVCTITYSDTKEVFIYRLYRISDSSSYEKRILASEIARTCAPHYMQMLKNRMHMQLGERISKYYQKDMLVASLMSYYRMEQEREELLQRQLKNLEEQYKPLI